jgi:hypothetical protein
MNKIISVALTIFLSGCATYKVEIADNASTTKTKIDAGAQITVTKENLYPGGFQCFEPMMFVLTLGIIPTHCVYTYSATSITTSLGQQETVPLGNFKITTIGGWAALLLAPLPKWNFGSPTDPEREIQQIISGES